MQKLYYSISEVSKLVDEEQHILRYWEKEFTQLKPKKNRGGNRIYSDKDINLIKQIKKLLRHDKLSLKGAQEQISKYYTQSPEAPLPQGGAKTFSLHKIDPGIGKTEKEKSGGIHLNRQEAIELYGILQDILAVLR